MAHPSGVGSAQHLSGELLAQKAGVAMTHVPYRGATPAVVDILGGRTEDEARNLLGEVGWTMRVTERNGESLAVTMDRQPNRLNVSVVDGKVTVVGQNI